MIVAKQRMSGIVEPGMAGGICIAVGLATPWLFQFFNWYSVGFGLWFILGGTPFVAHAAKLYRKKVPPLSFTPHGIEWNSNSFSLFRNEFVRYRWDEIAAARFIQWDDWDGGGEGIILELLPDVPNPWHPKAVKAVSNDLQKILHESVSGNVVFLVDEHWEWNPRQVATWINESIRDEQRRAQWL